MVWSSVWVTLAALSWTGVYSFDGCQIRYGRRGCYDKIHTGVLVTCDGLGRESHIPKSIPMDTVYLSLANFNIHRIERANFTRFKSIECMTILDSGIEELEPDTFSDLEVLHELELRNTRLNGKSLGFIAHPEFRANLVTVSFSESVNQINFTQSTNLQRLTALNLDGNGITYLDPNILSNLIAVERLGLSSNRISKMDWYRFSEMVNLNQLLLDDNRLQTIPEHVQHTFFAVKELRLAGNPFHCNCKLRWLKDYYEVAEDKVVDYDSVSCHSPFEGLMASIPPDRFICRTPADPIVSWTHVHGEEFAVTCNSTGDPSPTLQLSWGEGGDRIIVPPADDISKLHTATPPILIGPGPVKCVATNSEGEVIVEKEIPPLEDSGASSSQISLVTIAMATVIPLILRTL